MTHQPGERASAMLLEPVKERLVADLAHGSSMTTRAGATDNLGPGGDVDFLVRRSS